MCFCKDNSFFILLVRICNITTSRPHLQCGCVIYLHSKQNILVKNEDERELVHLERSAAKSKDLLRTKKSPEDAGSFPGDFSMRTAPLLSAILSRKDSRFNDFFINFENNKTAAP